MVTPITHTQEQDISFDPLFVHTLSLLNPMTMEQVITPITTTPKRGRPRKDFGVGDRLDDDTIENETSPISKAIQIQLFREYSKLITDESLTQTDCYNTLVKKFGYTYNQIYHTLNS